ncbi:MAG: hypothetical protein LKG25_01945 [Prevotella sp.]|nr:hypothetical protein [Prevotella sp.]MCI1281341.1 hypothetical protein [Prevotella sp.]
MNKKIMITQQSRTYLKPNCKMLSIEDDEPLCETSIGDVGYGGDLDKGTPAKAENTTDGEEGVWK